MIFNRHACAAQDLGIRDAAVVQNIAFWVMMIAGGPQLGVFEPLEHIEDLRMQRRHGFSLIASSQHGRPDEKSVRFDARTKISGLCPEVSITHVD